MLLDIEARIGELLTEQKEFVGHGHFNEWVESNLEIGRTQAWRFMKVFEHQSECSKMEHLKDAYQQIETLEAQERQSKEERDRSMIAEFRYKWKNLTLEVANELYVAREKLSNQGARTDLTSGKITRSWNQYCEDIGITKRTANNWLNQFFPSRQSSPLQVTHRLNN